MRIKILNVSFVLLVAILLSSCLFQNKVSKERISFSESSLLNVTENNNFVTIDSFQYQLDEFNDPKNTLVPLILAICGEAEVEIPTFNTTIAAVNWLNHNIEPFQIFSQKRIPLLNLNEEVISFFKEHLAS